MEELNNENPGDFARGCLSVTLRHRMLKKGKIKNWSDFESALKTLVVEAKSAMGRMKDGHQIFDLMHAIEPFSSALKMDKWCDFPSEPNTDAPAEDFTPCCHPGHLNPVQFANRCEGEQLLIYGKSVSAQRQAWGYVWGFLIGGVVASIVWWAI